MDLKHILFGFSGRINRAKYWLGAFLVFFAVCAIIFGSALGFYRSDVISGDLSNGFIALITVTMFAALVPILAISLKRLHDRDKGVEWLLIFFLLPGLLQFVLRPFGQAGELVALAAAFVISVWTIVELGFLRGTGGPNRFGPDPLQPTA
jgi:uncharacterized membrane protein YhaH (DUF805 family)